MQKNIPVQKQVRAWMPAVRRAVKWWGLEGQEGGTTAWRDAAAVHATREGPQRQAPATQRTGGRAPDPSAGYRAGQPWGDPPDSFGAGEWKPRHQLIRRHAGRRTAGAGSVTSTRSGGDPAQLLPRREGKTTVRVAASGGDSKGRPGQPEGPTEPRMHTASTVGLWCQENPGTIWVIETETVKMYVQG